MSSILTTTLLIWVLQAAQQENPFRKAMVGDWVEYKLVGDQMTGTLRYTVVAKDDKEASYEFITTFTILGEETVAPSQITKVDLTKPYDSLTLAIQGIPGTKMEKQGEGKEKIKIGGKVYDTRWIKAKLRNTNDDQLPITTAKIWLTPEVPVFGLLKMDLSSESSPSSTLEIVGSGSK
jgi:hypothetical protein